MILVEAFRVIAVIALLMAGAWLVYAVVELRRVRRLTRETQATMARTKAIMAETKKIMARVDELQARRTDAQRRQATR
jgi:hypothetical protein